LKKEDENETERTKSDGGGGGGGGGGGSEEESYINHAGVWCDNRANSGARSYKLVRDVWLALSGASQGELHVRLVLEAPRDQEGIYMHVYFCISFVYAREKVHSCARKKLKFMSYIYVSSNRDG
jgi:hypothetical protein